MNGERLHRTLAAVARDFGTPCYVYFMDRMRERVESVRAAFGGRFRISYAVKCNPNPALLRRLRGVTDSIDVSSAGEVGRGLAAGWEAAKISFTGPGKTGAELDAAVAAGVGEIVVESVDEAVLLDRVARAAGRRQRVLVRIAPTRVPNGFGLNMNGKPTPFGIDEEEIDAAVPAIRALKGLDLRGFHIYSGTQCLNPDAIAENYGIFMEIFRRVCSRHDVRPERLVFGSGMGIPYYDNDAPLDARLVGEKTIGALDEFRSEAAFEGAELVLEMGRHLVGEAGIYLMRVIRKKTSRGVEICVCDGGMHHHLGAAGHLGTLIQRNYRMFQVGDERGGQQRPYNLVGPLCTTIDTLARQAKFRPLEAGDLLGIHCSGAYGVTASPIHFISHAPPREVLVETVGGNERMEDCTQFAPALPAEGIRP